MDDFVPNKGKQQEHLSGKSSGHSNDNGRIDFPRKSNQEEYAAEIHPTKNIEDYRQVYNDTDSEQDRSVDAGKTTGYFGVGLGIASLFMWSLVLGPVAAILGLVAFNQGRKTSGGWAIGLGALSVLSYFILPVLR
ncbi:hypothetical protein D3C77_520380 [compost metagenome]